MQEDLIGQILQGQYKIIRELGKGGFGTTYLAEDLNIPVTPKPQRVIKKIETKDNLKIFQYLVQKFEKEAQTLYRLGEKYNFIPKLFAYFNQDNNFYLVQELIEGWDLIEEIVIGHRWSEAKVFYFLQEILSKLNLVHQEKIIHRDLKPSNIIRNRNGELILIDFGAVKEVQDTQLQKTTLGIGTRGYMPKEQIFGKPKLSSDIYAVGIIAIEALTGLPIFDLPEDDNDEIIWQDFISVSDNLAAILTKMVRSDYRDRYQNVSQVLADLEDLENTIESESELEDLDTIVVIKETELKAIELTTTKPYLKTFNFEVVTVNSYGEIIDRTNKQAEYFTEDLGNGITLDLVAIPGGTFMMGAPETEEGSSDYERPQHRVTVPPFYMGKFLVTQAQWKQVASFPKIDLDLESNPSTFNGDKLPVETITWYQAKEFCHRLSQRTGKQYRLPSEAEWEYACRAGTTTPFYFGETITSDLANYCGETERSKQMYAMWMDMFDEVGIHLEEEKIDFLKKTFSSSYENGPQGEYRKKTTPVGIFPPNAFGLYDMHGNLSEWCEDFFHKNYQGAANDGSVWLAQEDFNSIMGKAKIIRGGSFLKTPSLCTSAYRDCYCDRFPLSNLINIGFRVVYEHNRS
ncbi:MAG: bifunctional serine/threonine-protein kinase/formylglycine-generating enzyme family protein [Prochloraceae cyanobacterium]|nr:bifunctional serine/threonine-protein kinase/formylglycine-generating enzyme family protein [Prochloraceae cyanobacterium]